MRRILWIIPLLFFAAGHAAENSGWRLIGPEAGFITQIVPDRNHPKLWYVVNSGKLFRSEDAGRSWEDTSLSEVEHVAVHPASSQVFAVVSKRWNKSEIWASSDKGKSFELRFSHSPYFSLRRVVPFPLDPDILYGFGLSNWDLAWSQDGGYSWSNIQTLPFAPGQPYEGVYDLDSYYFNDLLVSPFDPKVIYACAEVELYERDCSLECWSFDILNLASYDGGASWKVLKREFGYGTVTFHTDPLFPQRAFASNDDSIWMLTRAGWQKVCNFGAEQVISVPRRPKELFALVPVWNSDSNRLSSMKVLHSTDGGSSWQEVNVGLRGTIAVMQGVDDPHDAFLAGTQGAGLYRRDSKNPWQPANSGFGESIVTQISAAGGSSLYAIVGYKFLFGSRDSGATWRNVTLQLPQYLPESDRLYSVAVNPRDPNHLIVILANGLAVDSKGHALVSRNGGTTWLKIDGHFQFVSFDPVHSNIVYMSDGYDVYKSTEGGNNPVRLPIVLAHYLYRMIVDEFDAGILYFLTFDAVYKSSDGGQTVRKINSGLKRCSWCSLEPRDMGPLPQKGGYLLINSHGDVYRTSNGGETWSRIAAGVGLLERIVTADSTGNRFIAIPDHQDRCECIYESSNGGTSWTRKKPFGYNVEALDAAGGSSQPLYVATTKGVFTAQRP